MFATFFQQFRSRATLTLLIGPTDRETHPIAPPLISYINNVISTAEFAQPDVYSSLDTLVTKTFPFHMYDVVGIMEHKGEFWRLQDESQFQADIFLACVYNALCYVKDGGHLFISRCYIDQARRALLDEFPNAFEAKVGIIDFCVIPKTN
jgi:hypothetical protein